jgi:hypothetical protein
MSEFHSSGCVVYWPVGNRPELLINSQTKLNGPGNAPDAQAVTSAVAGEIAGSTRAGTEVVSVQLVLAQ